MPTNTYTALATITLTGTASTVTFGSIPATYRDLVLTIGGSAASGGGFYLSFNGTGTGSVTGVRMLGYTGGTLSSTPVYSILANSSQSTVTAQIMDYSSTDKHKTFLVRSSRSDAVQAHAGRWASTSAINAVNITPETTDTWAIGTTFSLYGIAG